MYNEVVYSLINYVETNYDKQISIQDLENTANYSYRNLQRIFKYATGETIGAFQKRIKLEKGYKLLLYSSKSISEIALLTNFESIASFSKAFKQQFLCSPSQARLDKKELLQKNSVETTYINIAKPTIIFIPEIDIFYQSTLTDYTNEDIEKLWLTFSDHVFENKKVNYYGIIADEPLITEKIKCRYLAASNQQASNTVLPMQTIFGKKYAKFIHAGSYATIENTYQNIYTNWIFENTVEFDSSPIIEQYVQHSGNTISESDFITELLIPLL